MAAVSTTAFTFTSLTMIGTTRLKPSQFRTIISPSGSGGMGMSLLSAESGSIGLYRFSSDFFQLAATD